MKKVYVIAFFAVVFLVSCSKNEKVEYINLKSGIRAIFQHDNSPVTSAVFLIGAGNSIGMKKAADIMNKLIFEGSSIRTRQQIFQEIETFGGRIRFWTDDASSLIQIRSPSENFTKCFSIACETISHPLFDKEHISGVLKEQLNKGNRNSDVRSQIRRDVRALLFAGSVLADSTESSDEKMISYSLEKYYKKYYSPTNIVVAVSGDINVNDLLKTLSSCWKSSNGKGQKRTAKIRTGKIAAKRRMIRSISSGKSRLVFAFRAPGVLEKKYFAARLLNRITAANLNSILKDALTEKDVKVSSLNSYYFRDYGFGYFVIEAETDLHDLDKVEKVITGQIEEIKTDGISERYFIIGKRKVMSHLAYRMQYSSFKANVLAYLVFTGYSNLSFSSYYNQFKKLDLAQVNDAAKSIFSEPVIIKYIPK